MSDIEWNPNPVLRESAAEETVLTRPPVSRGWMWFVIIAGVLLPLAVYGFELVTRLCSMLFDPIPTYWHLALLALVPITNLAAVLVYSRLKFNLVRPLTFLIGVSIGVTFVYCIEFLPMAPLSLLAIAAFGLGLLGLSPYFALAATIVSSQKLRAMELVDAPARRKLMWGGILAGALPLALYLASSYITIGYLPDAASSDPQKSQHATKVIRNFGSKRVLLRECYGLPSYFWLNVWSSPEDGRVTPDGARAVYYKVMGKPFNSVPPPSMVGPRSRMVEDMEVDTDVGGTAVNSIVKNLAMTASTITARVDPQTMTSYGEWTMVFTNTSSEQQEARAEIALPPGAVVSRLTLWINGEEREAAFGTRGLVRQAYQQVAVVQRHDPVLVTSCGPDRILMQCFPVPPNGGEMKVRLGITSPLVPQSESKAVMVLPRVMERNYKMAGGLKHSLMVDATEPVSFGGDAPSVGIQKMISDADVSGGRATITCTIPGKARAIWAAYSGSEPPSAIAQRLVTQKTPAPRRLALVIDSSACMAPVRDEIAQALQGLPDTRLTIIKPDDSGSTTAGVDKPSDAAEEASMFMQHVRLAGGIDNRPALVAALDSNPDQVLWIHGPQPVMTGPYTEQLLQRLGRRFTSIVSVSAVDGHNVILDDLQRTGAITELPRIGKLTDDLKRLFSQWKAGETVALVRERASGVGAAHGAGPDDIVRLWVRDEMQRVLRRGDSRLFSDIAALAVSRRVVTALTGAVVLETKQQYKDAGLDPSDPKSVPSVTPEPSTWLALASGCGALCLYARRRRPRN